MTRTIWIAAVAVFITAGDARIPGWKLAGNASQAFTLALDRQTLHGGTASAMLAQTSPKPAELVVSGRAMPTFGTLMQRIRAVEYRGHRVRLTAWVKGENALWANIWFRADGPRGEGLAFDNQHNRPASGTFDWMRQEIVVNVPREAVGISFGLMLRSGRAWVDDVALDIQTERKSRITQSAPLSGPGNFDVNGLYAGDPTDGVNLDFEAAP